MNSLALLFDVAPSGSTIGAIVAAGFLLVFLGVAFIAFKALKRTVKMAFRMAIVAGILLIAVVGSVTLWYFSSDATPRLKPPADRPIRR
jgi:hypothetical protein